MVQIQIAENLAEALLTRAVEPMDSGALDLLSVNLNLGVVEK